MSMLVNPGRRFGLHGLNQQLPGPVSQYLGERIMGRALSGWHRQRFGDNVCHGGVLSAHVGGWGCKNTPKVRRLFQFVIHSFWL